MTNSPYGFGFPGAGDILSGCRGKNHLVYARATLDNRIYLETNGGPVELGEDNIAEAIGVHLGFPESRNRACALGDLADMLIRAGRKELGDWINKQLLCAGRAQIVDHYEQKRAFEKYRK